MPRNGSSLETLGRRKAYKKNGNWSNCNNLVDNNMVKFARSQCWSHSVPNFKISDCSRLLIFTVTKLFFILSRTLHVRVPDVTFSNCRNPQESKEEEYLPPVNNYYYILRYIFTTHEVNSFILSPYPRTPHI